MRLAGLILGFCLVAPLGAATLEEAQALVKAGRLAEAEVALTQLAVADPAKAEVAYRLGLLMNEQKRYDHGISWLERAVSLDPSNERYLADYGGSSLEEADRKSSYTLATKGRDAMIKAIAMDPKDIDARDGLMQFYARAPWPLGDKTKAREQAIEMGRLDPLRGEVAWAYLAITEKRYVDAIAACKRVLAKRPDDYAALYQLGRAASSSGTDLDLAITCLRKCLTLTPSSDDAGPSAVQYRLGTLLEKKGDYAGAKAAYRAAISLDPKNKAAVQALDKIHG